MSGLVVFLVVFFRKFDKKSQNVTVPSVIVTPTVRNRGPILDYPCTFRGFKMV